MYFLGILVNAPIGVCGPIYYLVVWKDLIHCRCGPMHTLALYNRAMHGLKTSSSTEHGGALDIGRIFLFYSFKTFMYFAFIINIVSHVTYCLVSICFT